MREIKFRAKTVTTDSWVYGHYAFVDGFHVIYEGTSNPVIIKLNTLGEYTGLKDKNGREIYEGDIVNHFYRYYVGMDEVSEEMNVVEIKDLTHLPFDLSTIGCEVIGNIYENPELLEVKGNE